MAFDGIDHVVFPVADLSTVSAAFERLGLRLTPRARHAEMGTENRVFFAGSASSLFYVELIGIVDPVEAAAHPRGAQIARAAGHGRLLTVMLRVSDLASTLARLAGRGVPATTRAVRRADGSLIGTVADLDLPVQAACALSLLQYAEPQAQRYARYLERGLLEHELPLRRLDHLAAVSVSLEQSCRFWSNVLGVPATRELSTAGAVIRRIRIGDAVLELVRPKRPDSSTTTSPPGVSSLVCFEVGDVAAVAERARAAGFSVPDPAPGPLPGTTRVTVSEPSLGGLEIQLLQYDGPRPADRVAE